MVVPFKMDERRKPSSFTRHSTGAPLAFTTTLFGAETGRESSMRRLLSQLVTNAYSLQCVNHRLHKKIQDSVLKHNPRSARFCYCIPSEGLIHLASHEPF